MAACGVIRLSGHDARLVLEGNASIGLMMGKETPF